VKLSIRCSYRASLLVSVGGDGTHNEVVEGLMQLEQTQRGTIRFAILSAGIILSPRFAFAFHSLSCYFATAGDRTLRFTSHNTHAHITRARAHIVTHR
jgi:hypothetical protein